MLFALAHCPNRPTDAWSRWISIASSWRVSSHETSPSSSASSGAVWRCEVVERIVVLDPAMQRMILIEADGGSGVSLDELVRQASKAESGKQGPLPVSAASIEAMPTVEVEAEEGMDFAVCLERVMGAAKEMPCRHRYHQECVEKCRPGYLCWVVSGVK